MKARKLGSSCAASASGFGGGQGHRGAGFCGAGAQAATSRISPSKALRMWLIYLEIVVVLGIAAFIVWFTWPSKRK